MASETSATIVGFLTAWAKEKNIIRRSKVPAEKKVLAVVLCNSGYPYRDVSKLLGGVSHVAIHNVYKSFMAAMPRPERKRRLVAIDENAVYLNSQTNGVVWLARDVDSGEILSFKCSASRSPEDGKKFVDSVLEVCTERPLLRVGRGANFPHSLKSLDLHFQIDTSSTIRQKITSFLLGDSKPGS